MTAWIHSQQQGKSGFVKSAPSVVVMMSNRYNNPWQFAPAGAGLATLAAAQSR